jgi:hypothetical protein
VCLPSYLPTSKPHRLTLPIAMSRRLPASKILSFGPGKTFAKSYLTSTGREWKDPGEIPSPDLCPSTLSPNAIAKLT